MEYARKFLKRPDALLQSLREGFEWTGRNLRFLLTISILIFVSSAIWVLASHYTTKRAESALWNFYVAQKEFDKKRLELKEKKTTNLREVLREELKKLEGVHEKHPSSKGALLSLLTLGDFFSGEKTYKDAIMYYEKAKAIADHPFYNILIFYNLGFLHEMVGDLSKAIDYYMKITALNKRRILFWSFGYRPNTFWLTSAYFGIGRCHERLNNPSAAREMYQRISDEFPDSAYADKAESFALLLGSKSQ